MTLYGKCLIALINVKKGQSDMNTTPDEVNEVIGELMSHVYYHARSIESMEDIDKLIPEAAMITFIRSTNDIPF